MDITRIENQKMFLGRYYQLFIFQYSTGCRVSEALEILPQDITSTGGVLIRAKKGGQDRIVFVAELASFFRLKKASNVMPFHNMNRFTAYRYLRDMGVTKLKKGRKNESVTHIFRDEFFKANRSVTQDKGVLSRSVGQSSQRSTDYYGRD